MMISVRVNEIFNYMRADEEVSAFVYVSLSIDHRQGRYQAIADILYHLLVLEKNKSDIVIRNF